MYNIDALKNGAALSAFSAYDYYLDAISNYKEKRYAACVCLITIAREEIGKSRILHKKIKEMATTDELNEREIFKLTSNHKEKIKFSLNTINIPLSKELIAGYQRACVENDSAALNSASEEITKLSKIRRSKLPDEIHNKRLMAQYVNTIGNGKWNSRESITLDDCFSELLLIGSEILTDLGWLLDDIKYHNELNIRGIDFNTIYSLTTKHMLEISEHKNIKEQ